MADEPIQLPDPVRSRVVAMAADALAEIPAAELPASVRAFASFAPRKRAKLAAKALHQALADDPEFRSRVTSVVVEGRPELGVAVSTGQRDDVDPYDLAAFAYLQRGEGWQPRLAEAVLIFRDAARPKPAPEQAVQAERLRAQLAEVRSELRRVRTQLREQLDEAKKQNAGLRHQLNEARLRAGRAQESEQRATAAADARIAAAKQAAEQELRTLRGRVADLEAADRALRRASGWQREAASVRVWLLLNSLVEAAGGLRSELGIPAASGRRPADLVAALEPGPETGRVAPADDAGVLDELLRLPQAHLIVDGYNVTKSGWPSIPLRDQRERLLSALGALRAQRRIEITVVFDGAELTVPAPVSPPQGVRVRFSPPGVIADDVIRELVRAEPRGRTLVVASSDAEVARSVAAMGARPVPALAMLNRLQRG